MKKAHVVICVLLLMTAIHLRGEVIEFGIKAGVIYSNLDFSQAVEEEWRHQAALRYGAFAGIHIFKPLWLQTEINFRRSGAAASQAYREGEIKINQELDYIELPVLLKLSFPLPAHFRAGCFGGVWRAWKIGAKSITQYAGETFTEDIEDEIEKRDFGTVVGLEFGWRNFLLDFRYIHGISDVRLDKSGLFTVMNRSSALTVGYRLSF